MLNRKLFCCVVFGHIFYSVILANSVDMGARLWSGTDIGSRHRDLKTVFLYNLVRDELMHGLKM